MQNPGRAQSLAGIATVAALPLLYFGSTEHLTVLVAVGFVVFTAGLLTPTALRFRSLLNRNRAGQG